VPASEHRHVPGASFGRQNTPRLLHDNDDVANSRIGALMKTLRRLASQVSAAMFQFGVQCIANLNSRRRRTFEDVHLTPGACSFQAGRSIRLSIGTVCSLVAFAIP
jgi:hypothetical protein